MNVPKNIRYLALSILLMLQVGLVGQTWFYFDGHVYNENNLEPIYDYPVFISAQDTVFRLVYTDHNGYYIDSVYASPESFTHAALSVEDCFGEIDYAFFEPPREINTADFEICVMPGGDCQALFDYDFDFDDPQIVNFYDLSIGNINKWTWDFGDFSISNEENPTHEYAESGAYQVVLVVEDTTGFCWSVYDEFVVVGGTNNCEAYFEKRLIDSSDFLMVQYMDLSLGNIDFWEWDFGDGNWSNEQNPIHTYSEPGVYEVCLTISDNSDICFDTYCEIIFIGDTIECIAEFNVQLDTLNNTPHTFIFSDNSSGNIISWLWDFGDGNFSQQQNPVHTYGFAGNYNVCLYVSSDPAGGQCFDEECAEVSTLQYYNFGGHAFIDGFPINIEEDDSSNVATAYLYRRIDNQWKYMDEKEFWKFGYYWFVEKPEGEYLLRIDLNENSNDFGYYAPSYFVNSNNWMYASIFDLNSDDQFTVDINLIGLSSGESGIGSINGMLKVGLSCEGDLDLNHQIVKLFDGEGSYIDFVYTDQEGEFEFNSLGNGMYRLEAEVTGNSSSVAMVEITNSNPSSFDNTLEINCQSFVGIEDHNLVSENLKVINVFPQPVRDIVNLRIQSLTNENISVEITDQIGRVIKANNYNIYSGESTISLNLSDLTSGLYIYKILISNGVMVDAGKIIHQ